eukprot:4692013-Amphidinium_carterae.1
MMQTRSNMMSGRTTMRRQRSTSMSTMTRGLEGGKDKGGKDSKTVTCSTCGQQGHISPNCPTKKGGKGNKGQKGQRPYNGQWYDGKGYQEPQSHCYQQNGYSGYSGQPLNTGQPPAN